MKKSLKTILTITGVLLAVFTAGCDEYVVDESDFYNFQVISHDGEATGYYIVDGGEPKRFTTKQDSGSDLYTVQKNLSSPTSIRIVTDSSTTITSIEIYVYQNSKEVCYAEDGISADGDTVYASLYYEFESSDEEESD